MTPKKPGDSTRSNKIRFVLVEADISDGNLSELTQAITSALKPTVTPMRPALRSAPPAVLPANNNGASQEEESEPQTETEVVEAESGGDESATR